MKLLSFVIWKQHIDLGYTGNDDSFVLLIGLKFLDLSFFYYLSPLCSLHAGNTIQHNTRYMYAPKPKVHNQLRNRKEIIFCSSMMLKKVLFFFSQQTNEHNKNVVGKARGHMLILLAAWLKKYQSQFNLTFSDLSTAAGSIHSALKLTHRLPPQCAEKLH